ncbi:XRE family transcriptional regulator [Carnobacterium divergens]|uniref:XRE family transcriptional regulator n=1 Tax=Carnobacterium divergens TaxID=2748 RepID=UPI00288F43FF|nr:XRE family transcriptional regulator [Carnobacterium divergens]MDT1950096.1 XRE family transcriptional regulator [Carnobacterium divergens]MDT1955274.1 XRE family transcriptional regulator [Carnobacterium divergens]MDT1960512.1 XRE family transcriptional regulator [Carnobacterium divergens]MDT1963056.1 XRE family transcriptional regulator [Carnobacterium divergens]
MNKESYLKELMEIKSGTVKAFSEQIGIPYTTVRSILERGIMNAKMDNIIKICNGLNITPESLMAREIVNSVNKTYEDKIITVFSKLKANKKQKVISYAQQQLEEQEYENKIYEIPLVGKSAANPSIIEYGDVDIELGSFAHIPYGADCAIVIQGDSMEPLIKDGEIIFYKKQPDIENGEIAIVEINGDGVTCKKVYFNIEEQTIILRSLNDKYSDREVNDDEIRIVGKVILN